MKCYFTACEELVVPGTFKCARHQRKSRCSVAGCLNQIYSKGVCVRHGARSSPCCIQGCNRNERVSGLCNHHATVLPETNCSHPGCTAKARGSATCKRHRLDCTKVSSLSSSSRRRRANTAAARKRSRTIVKVKYNNQDEQAPNAVSDNKPLPASFFDGFEDMLAEMVSQKMTFHVPDVDVTVYEM
ncbi:unnamed protein product [Aphanomyces euteiches]